MSTHTKFARRAGMPRSAESGFTLIETMIAGLIFTIGALALAFVIPMGVNRITDAGQQTGASELATERSEFLQELPQSDTLMTAGNFTDPANPYPGQLYVTWTIEDGQPISGCKRISVFVRRGSVTAPILARTILVSSAAGSGS